MRRTKNLEKIAATNCVCPISDFRSGFRDAVGLAREFIRENTTLGGVEIELGEDGSLFVRWEQFASKSELIARDASNPLPAQVWGVKITMIECIPMFKTHPETGLPDGMPLREDFPEALKTFCKNADNISAKARGGIFHPIYNNSK